MTAMNLAADDESTTGENLGKEATEVLALVRDLVDSGLVDEHAALDAMQIVVNTFTTYAAIDAIEEVRAYLDRPIVPEFPGGTLEADAQPHVSPRIAPDDEDEETVDIMVASQVEPIATRRARPAPRLKDPSKRTSPRLPDGLGQANAQEES